MYLEENIKRKVRIRNEVYKNMIGGDSYSVIRLGENEKERLRKRLYVDCTKIDEYSCNKVYTDIPANNKVQLFIKKLLRRFFYKLMGWYYVPMIEGQIEYNMQVKEIISDLQRLVDSQQEEIKELYSKINDN